MKPQQFLELNPNPANKVEIDKPYDDVVTLNAIKSVNKSTNATGNGLLKFKPDPIHVNMSGSLQNEDTERKRKQQEEAA